MTTLERALTPTVLNAALRRQLCAETGKVVVTVTILIALLIPGWALATQPPDTYIVTLQNIPAGWGTVPFPNDGQNYYVPNNQSPTFTFTTPIANTTVPGMLVDESQSGPRIPVCSQWHPQFPQPILHGKLSGIQTGPGDQSGNPVHVLCLIACLRFRGHPRARGNPHPHVGRNLWFPH